MAELVVSTGTYTVKAGYADVVETSLLPSVETPSYVYCGGGKSAEDRLEEEEESVVTSQVIEAGDVRDWAGLEVVWRHVLYEQLGWIEGEEGNLLLTEPRGLSRYGKECMMQLLFEQLNVSGAFFAEEPVLALYAVGKVSGLVVDVGHAGTGVTAVADGLPLAHGATEVSCGGRHLSQLMAMALAREGASEAALGTFFDRVYDTANSLGCHAKERAACVAATEEEFDAAVASTSNGGGSASSSSSHKDESFTLPDGSTISIRSQDRLAVGEALFRPELISRSMVPSGAIDISGPGIVEAAVQVLLNCPPEQRRVIADQIVVCGGSSRLQGFNERFLGELVERAPGSQRPTIVPVPEYLDGHSTLPYASWVGGAILAKHVFPQNQHITRYEYDENGPARVVRGYKGR